MRNIWQIKVFVENEKWFSTTFIGNYARALDIWESLGAKLAPARVELWKNGEQERVFKP